MRRGEIWSAAARGGAYTGKPGPVVIVQDDRFDATDSVTVCAFTTAETAIETPLLRIPIDPTGENGLKRPSKLMVDKLTTMPRANLTSRIGELTAPEMRRLSTAIVVFLGIA